MTLLPGAECSQLLSLEKVTWLWIPLPVLLPADPLPPPPPPSPLPILSRPPLSFTPLLSEVIFSAIMKFSPLFSAPIRLAQQGVVNSLLSANFHIFPAWDANTSSAPQSGTTTSPTNTDTHAYKTQFSAPARPHTRWAFRSERTGVAYVIVITE